MILIKDRRKMMVIINDEDMIFGFVDNIRMRSLYNNLVKSNYQDEVSKIIFDILSDNK